MDNLKSELAKILKIDEKCTDKKLIEEIKKLKIDDEMLNLAIDNSVDSFNIADKKGVFIRVNETMARNTNSTREYMEGKSTQELVKEEVYGPNSAIMLAIKEKRRVALLQGGIYNEAIAISTPIFDEKGNIKYIVSNARFINELNILKKYVGAMNSDKDAEFLLKDHKKMIWHSSSMKDIFALVKTIAPTDASIMITGETGTGKSMLARFIHENSVRSEGEFVEINCAAIPENLIESELFGYESGAFTGANSKGKKGLIRSADGGTLFLDEIGDMPLNLQAKLLQTLQNRTVTSVGGEEAVDVNIRLITATSMDLENMVEKNLFRRELFYRINVVPIHIPPLRKRIDDIPLLVDSALENINREYGKKIIMSSKARKSLISYSWPGNIRELENVIERLAVTNRTGVIMEEDLPSKTVLSVSEKQEGVLVKDIMPLNHAVETVERQLIQIAYMKNKSSYKVAKELGISQSAANRKIKKYIKSNKND